MKQGKQKIVCPKFDSEELKQNIIDALIENKTKSQAAIARELGQEQHKISMLARWLTTQGHHIVNMAGKRHEGTCQLVICGRTEEEATAARKKEKANESDALKEARRRHRKLLNLEYKRELQDILTDPLERIG